MNLLKKVVTAKNFKASFLLAVVLTFLLLLYKNPFSERTLIPNLEPFPDSVYYLTPPLSFVHGKGFAMERNNQTININVPFLYSLVLIPGFLIVDDVRFFYLTNIILALTGMFFFYKFLNQIVKEEYSVLLVLLLYVTNYFIFWFPNLPMAENLFLPLYLISLYLLASKVTVKKTILFVVITVSLYATKYAALVITLTFLTLYLTRILLTLYPLSKKITSSLNFQTKSIVPIIFILTTFSAFALFFLSEFLVKGNNILVQIYQLITPLFIKPEVVTDSAGVAVAPNSWFSLSYFDKNFPLYLSAITGTSMRFLWDYTPLLPKYIAIPALIGIFTGLLTKGYRFISFSLLLLILLPIIFMSTFYSPDARYIYNAIPSLLAGFALFLNFIYLFFKTKHLTKIFFFLLTLFLLFYCFTNFYRLKYQIVLNLKYAETPWYYLAVKNIDNYFKSLPNTGKPPVLITTVAPYYMDFYSDAGIKLLPLSGNQDFIRASESIWGPDDYSDFMKLYQKYLGEGYRVYVTNAGMGNVGYLLKDFDLIKLNFNVTKVNEGCFDTCNIYQVTPKNP